MRRVWVFIAVTILVVVLSGASETRLLSMGRTNPYLQDDMDMYANPAWLNRYSNFVSVNFGNKGLTTDTSALIGVGDVWADVRLEITSMFNVGLSFNKQYLGEFGNWGNYEPEVILDNLDMSEETVPLPMNDFTILGGMELENLDIGLAFYEAGAKDNYDASTHMGEDTSGTGSDSVRTTTEKAGSGVMGFKLGTVFGREKPLTVEGAFGIMFNSAKYNYHKDYNYTEAFDDSTIELDGGLGINVNSRVFYDITEKLSLCGNAQFSTISYSKNSDYKGADMNMEIYQISGSDTTYWYDTTRYDTGYNYDDYSDMALNFGLGTNYKLPLNGTLACGIGMFYDRFKHEYKTEKHYSYTYSYHDPYTSFTNDTSYTETIPSNPYTQTTSTLFFPYFNLGLEIYPKKWFVTRLGVYKYMGSEKRSYNYTDPDNENEYVDTRDNYTSGWRNSDFLTFGIGFNFSSFRLDFTVSDKSLFSGTYLFSGNGEDLFTSVSASYEF